MELATIRSLLNEYLIVSEDLFWKNWVGLLDEIDMDGLYRKYSSIFTLEAIDTAKTLLHKEQDPDAKKRMRALTGQLILGYMEYQARQYQQEILKKEAASEVIWEGKPVPIRGFGVQISNEPDRDRRKAMIAARELVTESQLNPVRIRYVENLFDTVEKLGYTDYVELCSDIQDRNFDTFAEEMIDFLNDSEPIFLKYLSKYLKSEAALDDPKEAHEGDLAAVFRCPRFDPFFPASNLMPCVKSTIAGLGFKFDKIHLDLENRPKKKPRACVSAVNPPDDVRLTIFPIGGYDDYAGFLHETGHAIHFAHERPDLDFEFKYWGDRGFTEGTAYLFQHITMNSAWLKNLAGMPDQSAYLEFNAFLNILRFRRLIAQFIFQMDLFKSKTVSGMGQHYQTLMGRAHGVHFEPSGYLNFDLELYSAGYLRARMFEQQLRSHFEKSAGQDWWNQPDSSKQLIELYKDGRKSRADDVIRQFGFERLDSRFYLNTQLTILS